LRFVLPVLLRNLDRYPQDRPTIARALAALGAAHPDHAGTHTGLCGCERVSIPRSRHAGAAYYVEELLGLLHDTDQPEGSVDDPRCRSIGASGHSASRHTHTTEPGACVVCVCVCVCWVGWGGLLTDAVTLAFVANAAQGSAAVAALLPPAIVAHVRALRARTPSLYPDVAPPAPVRTPEAATWATTAVVAAEQDRLATLAHARAWAAAHQQLDDLTQYARVRLVLRRRTRLIGRGGWTATRAYAERVGWRFRTLGRCGRCWRRRRHWRRGR
jgi:hypothetical protein